MLLRFSLSAGIINTALWEGDHAAALSTPFAGVRTEEVTEREFERSWRAVRPKLEQKAQRYGLSHEDAIDIVSDCAIYAVKSCERLPSAAEGFIMSAWASWVLDRRLWYRRRYRSQEKRRHMLNLAPLFIDGEKGRQWENPAVVAASVQAERERGEAMEAAASAQALLLRATAGNEHHADILRAFVEHEGNMTAAAKALGVSRQRVHQVVNRARERLEGLSAEGLTDDPEDWSGERLFLLGCSVSVGAKL